MMIRYLGAVFIVFGAAGAGIAMAADFQKQCAFYQQLQGVLLQIKNEIEFSLTPLGELCEKLSETTCEPLSRLFSFLCGSFASAPGRPAGIQMRRALKQHGILIPAEGREILAELFDCLGKQDVLAQIRAVELAERRTENALKIMEKERTERCRAYRTLGICAGLSVAVILL